MVAQVIVVGDEGVDLGLEVAGQIVVFERCDLSVVLSILKRSGRRTS